MSPQNYRLFYQRRLPHYQPPGATLFITFRLAGSLPQAVIERLEAEMDLEQAKIERTADSQSQKQATYSAQKKLFGKWDVELDLAKSGPTWLSDPDIASMVSEVLHQRNNKEYILEAYCIMPNHVHLVCTPLQIDGVYIPMSAILHSLKGNTAYQANRLLGRQGRFWQHESYDHVVRDAEELNRIVNYVLENPRRAGLPERWVYSRIAM